MSWPKPGAPPKLTPAQVRYVQRAFDLRNRLTNKVLAKRFGVSPNTINHYGGKR